MPSLPPSKREILVFEPDVEGHSQEWLQHLVDFVATNDQAAAIAVLAPPALCATLSRSIPAVADGRIRFIAMKPSEVKLCSHRSLSLAAFARWWVMRRYLRRSGADMGFFLCLDLLSLPLAFGLRTHGKPLAGILFRPSVHYAAFGDYRPGLGEWLRDVRKDLLYRLMLRNPAVATILSLDPFFPAHAADHYRHGGKVQALPDPAHPAADSAATVVSADIVPAGRIAFLLFGYLTERKGPLMVLDALRLLPQRIAARVAVLFAGRIDPAIREAIETPPRRAGPRAARSVAAHRRSPARSRRARQSCHPERRHPGALSTLRRLERRAAVGGAGRTAGAGPVVRSGRPADARSSPRPGRQFVGSRQACGGNRAHGRRWTANLHRSVVCRGLRVVTHAASIRIAGAGLRRLRKSAAPA